MYSCIFAVILILSITGCTKTIDDQTITIAISADIRGFDPAFATDLRTGQVMTLLYDNLVQFDPEMNLIPGVAKHWSISADGRTYIFIIRNDIQFYNGPVLGTSDIINSFKRLLDPQITSPQSWLFDRIAGAQKFISGQEQNVSGLQAPNDSTIIIKLLEPFTPFIQYLAMPSAAIINADEVSNFPNYPAGSGPWLLEKWTRDGEILLYANKNYWGRPPKTNRLRIRILSEVMTHSAEFEAGQLDVFEVPASEKIFWQGKGYHSLAEDQLNIWYIGMNCSRPPFNNIALRQAMNYAVDREKIIRLLLNESARISTGPVPPQLLVREAENNYQYNPQQAFQLLQKAGYTHGLNTELLVAGNSKMFHVLEALQADWAAIGVTIKIVRSDWNLFKTAVREGKPDLYYLDWFADYPDGENFLYPLFHSKESMIKRNRFSDPEVDDIIERIQRLPMNSERQGLIQMAHELISSKAPWVFLWHDKKTTLTQKWIYGFQTSPIFNAQRYTTVTKNINLQ